MCGLRVIAASLGERREVVGACEERWEDFLKDFIYLFFTERGGREKERERIIYQLRLARPNWGPGLQPRHVP